MADIKNIDVYQTVTSVSFQVEPNTNVVNINKVTVEDGGLQNLQSVTNIGASTTNSITASSFVKQGGLSTEFLMSDGSVTIGNGGVYSYEIHVSQVDGNDTTGTGAVLNPVATITKALTLITGQRKTIIIHPGNYTESPSITSQYTVLTTYQATGGNTLITGTVTTNTGCSISGLKMTALTINGVSGRGNINILNCDISGTFTKSGTADYTLIRFCDIGALNIVSSAGALAVLGGNLNFITINSVGAAILVKNAVCVSPVVLIGSATFADCILISTGPTTNALTTSAGTNIVLANSQCVIPTFQNVSRVSLSGFYSILNCVFDKPNSTLVALSGTGGSTNSIVYSQFINADKFIKQGGLSTEFLMADGNVSTGLATTVYVDNQDALKVDKVVGERLINASEITKLSNQSGTNTGDNATNTQYSGLATSKYDASNPSGYQTAAQVQAIADAKVVQTITNGVTATAPSQDAVFDALALKANDNAVVHTTGAETIAGAKTFSTAPILTSLTASQLLALDASKNIQTLTTDTYPSLTELAFVKGATSNLQTQINAFSLAVEAQLTYLDMDYTIFDAFYTRVIADSGTIESTSQLLSTLANLRSISYTAQGYTQQINADKFVKLGGASDEFLMADGSISFGGGGATNLGYTASPTNGIVTSNTGTDATLPLADGTNAGLLTAAEKTKITNTSGTNTGDNATNTTSNSYADAKVVQTIIDGVTATAPSQNAVFDALALKANDNAVVHLAGSETMTGIKTIAPVTQDEDEFPARTILTVTNADTEISSDTILGKGIVAFSNGIAIDASSVFGKAINAFSEVGIAINAVSYESTAIQADSDVIAVKAISGVGTSIFSDIGTSGKGLVINSATASTGNVIEFNKNNVNKLLVNQAGELTATKLIKQSGTSEQLLAANGDSIVFKDIAQQVYTPTPVWTATTAPTGTTNHTYQWSQIGKTVNVRLNLSYTTLGVGATIVVCPFPTDLPVPFSPSGLTTATANLYYGTGLMTNSNNSQPTTLPTFTSIRRNAANTGYELTMSRASNAPSFVYISIQYFAT